MATYRHPSELNPWQRFTQANRILQKTNRASNPAWYKQALDLDFQVHLRTDGAVFECRIYDRVQGSWTAGPAFEDGLISNPEKAAAYLHELLELAVAAKSKALGIVLHYAEDFATAELKHDAGGADSLSALRTEIERNPKSVLADNSSSIEESSWRLLPYPATGAVSVATAVGVTRRWQPLLDVFRETSAELNFPVIIQTLNAPLVAMLSLAEAKKDAVTRPILALIPYSRFTVIGFFDASGDLLLLRSMQHRGQRGPGNLRQVISATAASLEMTDPEVHILATDPESDQKVMEELGFATLSPEALASAGIFRHSQDQENLNSPLPVELRVINSLDIAPGTPLGESRTFSTLRTDGWVTQDFLPEPVERREVFPDRGEMQLFRITRYVRRLLFVVAAVVLGLYGQEFVKMIGQPEWSYKAEDAQAMQRRQAMLGQQKAKIEYWDNLLSDRSKAWSSMELLPRLIQRDGDLLLKSCTYSVTPVNVPGQPKLGLTKVWKLSGYGRQKSLSDLTTENLVPIFNTIFDKTGAESFRLSPELTSRSLEVNVKSQENTSYLPGPGNDSSLREDSFPFIFELTITQKFAANDPFALNTAKAP